MRNKSVNIDTLVLETTRRCNMSCPHCLRGDAQNLDLPDSILKQVFKTNMTLGTIVLSGGEPSLAVPVLKNILRQVQKHQIATTFYLATNGKDISKNPKFLHTILDWSVYCRPYEYDYFGGDIKSIALSEDCFHEEISQADREILHIFANYSEYDKKYKTSKNNAKPYPVLINEGRARDLTDIRKRDLESYLKRCFDENYDNSIIHTIYMEQTTSEDAIRLDVQEPSITINVHGWVLADCNNAYDNPVNLLGILSDTHSLFDILKETQEIMEHADNNIFDLKTIWSETKTVHHANQVSQYTHRKNDNDTIVTTDDETNRFTVTYQKNKPSDRCEHTVSRNGDCYEYIVVRPGDCYEHTVICEGQFQTEPEPYVIANLIRVTENLMNESYKKTI